MTTTTRFRVSCFVVDVSTVTLLYILYTLNNIKVLQIIRDDTFIHAMVDKLTDFDDRFFRQSVLKQYFYRNSDKYIFCY